MNKSDIDFCVSSLLTIIENRYATEPSGMGSWLDIKYIYSELQLLHQKLPQDFKNKYSRWMHSFANKISKMAQRRAELNNLENVKKKKYRNFMNIYHI